MDKVNAFPRQTNNIISRTKLPPIDFIILTPANSKNNHN